MKEISISKKKEHGEKQTQRPTKRESSCGRLTGISFDKMHTKWTYYILLRNSEYNEESTHPFQPKSSEKSQLI